MENSFDEIVEKFSIPTRPPAEQLSRKCLNCGEKFVSRIPNKLYCSIRCGDIARRHGQIPPPSPQFHSASRKTKKKTRKEQRKEQRRKNRDRSGEATPPPKKPVFVDYYKYIVSDEWKKKAAEAKVRAKNRCQVCYRKGSEIRLNAHHRTYCRLGQELPEDITVLCEECHEIFSKAGKLAKY